MENRFGFAKRSMPSKCPDCGLKMGPIEHGVKFDLKYKRVNPPWVTSEIWRMCQCGCVITWTVDCSDRDELPYYYHQVFMRRHILPLFDDRLVLEVVDRN